MKILTSREFKGIQANIVNQPKVCSGDVIPSGEYGNGGRFNLTLSGPGGLRGPDDQTHS